MINKLFSPIISVQTKRLLSLNLVRCSRLRGDRRASISVQDGSFSFSLKLHPLLRASNKASLPVRLLKLHDTADTVRLLQ